MKKVCLVFSLLLSGCASMNSAELFVRSDLNHVSNKSVYYNIRDSSIVAARINKIVRKRLKAAGWEIGANEKTTRYSYSIFTDTATYTVNHVMPTQNGGAVVAPQTVSYPFFSVEIKDNKTRENVYEAHISLSSERTYAELERFVDISAPALFLNGDKTSNIECDYERKGEEEFEKCSLKDPNEITPLFKLP